MSRNQPPSRPLAELDRPSCELLEGIFCDIDDTLTTDGRLTREAYAALWDAHEAGLVVVPVTGRPAGWVDHFARMWPVKAVVGENGGFWFWMERGGIRRRFVQPAEVRAANREKLRALREEILLRVPGCAVSADQGYREIDLAIDFCEDVPPLGDEAAAQIARIFHEHGACAKISSIHVNGWFGEFDKLTSCKTMAAELLGVEEDELFRRFAFCGDSPNDEPMFGFFESSVGVANVTRFLPRLRFPPTYVTNGEGGTGFAELVSHILDARGGAG